VQKLNSFTISTNGADGISSVFEDIDRSVTTRRASNSKQHDSSIKGQQSSTIKDHGKKMISVAK
jgi:hypothetical protein